MIVETAEIVDIDLLTELRIAYLKEDYGKLDEENITACAFLLVVEKPMSPAFITGKTGTVLNVYTKPSYRHRGYAKKIMEKLLSDAVEKKLSVVELKSTEDGYYLYKSVGFTDEVSKYHVMKWYHQQ